MKEINIVYIAGETRSGTTLIDRVLGTLPSTSSLCELSYAWQSGFIENNICSCGEKFSDCSFWSAVSGRLGNDKAIFQRAAELEQRVIRSRYFLNFYFNLYSKQFASDLAEYRGLLGQLIHAIAAETGSTTLIDSSKYPSGPLVLAGIPEVEVSVVHVIRDLRGFVYSMQKGNTNPAYAGKMAVRSPLSSINGWIVRNLFIEMLKRKFPYQQLIYDTCVEDPERCFARLCSSLPVFSKNAPNFVEGASIDLPEIHTVSGNPHRFSNGMTTLRRDNEWQHKMSASHKRLATVLGYPLLKKYGLLDVSEANAA